MGNASRKERKRNGEKFVHPDKTPTPRRAKSLSARTEEEIAHAAYRVARDVNWGLVIGRYAGKSHAPWM